MIPFTYCFVGPCIKKLSIPQFQPDQGFIPRPIYAFLLFPCHCQSCLVFCFFLDVFECSTKSQSHLFGNWLHSAALISIWNGQQHFALTAFHAASRRFLNFSPLTSIECRGLHQNKTALMKAWRLLLTYPMWQERDVSQQQWTDKFFSFCQKVAYSMFFSGSAACKAYFPLLFFRTTLQSYEFASLLTPLLCHCNFTEGFMAFGGLHSEENSTRALLCQAFLSSSSDRAVLFPSVGLSC